MKYFFVQGEYSIPFTELTKLSDLVAEHRAYVQQAYDDGHYLLSGPEVPADTGVVIARAPSRTLLNELMEREPFVRDGKVRISRVVEFVPARHRPQIEDWVVG
ncbi:YciI family protein [Novosphingobium sp. Gsoil 351]|uniref:YciI family protein n=1 Tax=Novosphingobium sp. Gsoil 351 TaxID=2675225 RepID=UPI001E64E649|nr:YciI family protein [Novosphingobium sp. Gsoil 351]